MQAIQGQVVSLKTPGTAIVLVERRWQHPVYGKFVRTNKKYACHYLPETVLAEGDSVEITPTRPMSRTKRFLVVRKVS